MPSAVGRAYGQLFFRLGTLSPLRRASHRPIAIACLRLFTFLPERPDLRAPYFSLCTARLTLLDALGPYFLRDDLVAMFGNPLTYSEKGPVLHVGGYRSFNSDRLRHPPSKGKAISVRKHVFRLRSFCSIYG